jgi:hypothetical protein
MIQVQIGDEKRNLEDVQPHWIQEQLARRRRDNPRVCVRVWFRMPQANFVLSTPDCPRLGRGIASLSPREHEIFALWKRLRLNDPNLEGNDLWAFLKQVSR